MRNPFTFRLILGSCLAGAILFPGNAGAAFVDTMEFDLQAGLRQDQLDWNIPGQNINVLSELDWEDLEIWQVGLTGKMAFASKSSSMLHPYVRGSLDYGWIRDGTARDSDYNGNNRTMEIFRSLSATEDDNVFDGSVGFGFERKIWIDRITLGLLGGYSYHEQNLRLSKGLQVISHGELLIPSQPIPGLNTTYESKWYGPFAGIDFTLQPRPDVSFLFSLEYHWSDYEGEGNWNLRTDLAHPVSFRHEADTADGVVATFRGNYFFSNGWGLDLTFVYRDFSANDGVDQTFLANGATITTKFNEANWQSSAITVGLAYQF